jgi:hypothetical protein
VTQVIYTLGSTLVHGDISITPLIQSTITVVHTGDVISYFAGRQPACLVIKVGPAVRVLRVDGEELPIQLALEEHPELAAALKR